MAGHFFRDIRSNMDIEVVMPDDRSEIVLQQLAELSKRVVDDFCLIAELLHETWEFQYHKVWGYASFQECVEQKFDIKGRKGFFLVQIAKTVQQLGLEWNEIKEIGWRKAAVIGPILNSDNKDRWIGEAKALPLPHLSERVKATKQGREPSDNPPIRMTIQVDADEQSIINSAIDYARRFEGVKTPSQALVKICYEFAQSVKD